MLRARIAAATDVDEPHGERCERGTREERAELARRLEDFRHEHLAVGRVDDAARARAEVPHARGLAGGGVDRHLRAVAVALGQRRRETGERLDAGESGMPIERRPQRVALALVLARPRAAEQRACAASVAMRALDERLVRRHQSMSRAGAMKISTTIAAATRKPAVPSATSTRDAGAPRRTGVLTKPSAAPARNPAKCARWSTPNISPITVTWRSHFTIALRAPMPMLVPSRRPQPAETP